MSYIIGMRIKAFREKCEMTQKQLAKSLGVKEAVISNWETGKNRPNVDFLPDICTSLGVTADELLGVEKCEDVKLSLQATAVAEKFDKAEEKKRKLVIDILNL